MFKIIALVIIVLIVAVLIYAATRPDTFRIQRATSVNAPPEKIVPFINDFHRWAAWSPYEKKDPAMKRTFSGTETDRGAVYEWEGDRNVGKGRMEIMESSQSKVAIKLDFIEPFEAHNIAEFTLEPQTGSTKVTWAMQGPSPYLMKVMHLFLNMDRMVGKDFETGLASLKTVAEQDQKAAN
jgi:carbon monoxide dehydrogenase subunit G